MGRLPVVLGEDLQALSEKPLRETRFFQKLNKEDKKRILELEKQFRDDTNGELSETEYERLAAMRYFVDFIELHMKDKGVQEVPEALLAEYRRANEIILNSMNEWRQKRVVKKDSILELKKAFLEFEKVDGGLVTIEVENEIRKVVDLTDAVIRTGESEEDKEDYRDIVDLDPEKDENRDSEKIPENTS
jgi:hypothetical protein